MITPTSLDKLSKMDDRDLDTTLNRLQRSIFKTRKRKGDTHDLEIEFCYMWREREVRQKRKVSHARWLSLRSKKPAVA